MSKPAALIVAHRRIPAGRLLLGVSVLILLSSPVAAASLPDPALRRSEQIDLRRLGKVSDDERAVLRIEWRAGRTGVEEAQTMQGLLDSLRRMETSITEIGRLLRNLPARQPAAAAVAEVAESGDGDNRLLLANIAAAALVALWWFGRRKRAGNTAVKAEPEITPAPRPATAAAPVRAAPKVAAPVTAAPIQAPPVPPPPTPVAPVTEVRRETPAAAPRPVIEAIAPTPAAPPAPLVVPPAAIEPAPQPTPEPPPAAPRPPDAETLVIDFSLEEADPETVARANARAAALRIETPPAEAEPEPETNVEPTLQLAEIMLSMGLEQGAAQALLEYTEANPRQAVYHWLKLLGIYRKRGLQQEFMETAAKLRQHFNVQAEDWERTGTDEAPTLEKFSRVADQAQQLWSQPAECLSYLRHLLEDNRDGARAGFPQAVAEEILLLIEILKAETAATAQAADA